MSDDYLYLPAENPDGKYAKYILSGAIVVMCGLFMVVAMFTHNYHKGVYDSDRASIGQILPIIMFFIPAFGVKQIKDGLREKSLYFKAAMNGLVIDENGIKGSIALLEGPTRNALREKQEGIFFIPWERVESFIVEPIRGRKVHSSPRYYKIAVKGGNASLQTSYYILRSYFEGREERVLAEVGKYLKEDQIIFNDKLSKEKYEEKSDE